MRVHEPADVCSTGKRISMRVLRSHARRLSKGAVLSLLLLSCPTTWPQVAVPKAATPEPQPESPKDTLGRSSPRGTVLGFLPAARKGNAAIAALYLNTRLRFGVNPTAALAGLGVGGIGVALAAQKTLENVIGGISLIADQAVPVGDILKLGDISGTVEDVGLRSTRIRTLERTVVSMPNGQIASMSLETFSARDKFWFHPLVGLRYETTPAQLCSVITGIRKLLTGDCGVDSDSVRVRFVRFAAFSLDVDIFAYVFARDWSHFLEIQEELLLGIIDVVQQAGAEIAFPSQTMYLATNSSDKPAQLTPAYNRRRGT